MYLEEVSLSAEKGFIKLLCLGYMNRDDVCTYLKDVLLVADESHRKTIFEHFGGHFTHLQDAADALAVGRFDAFMSEVVQSQESNFDARLGRVGANIAK